MNTLKIELNSNNPNIGLVSHTITLTDEVASNLMEWLSATYLMNNTKPMPTERTVSEQAEAAMIDIFQELADKVNAWKEQQALEAYTASINKINLT